jgi:RNA polymerase sigma-70 factor, ECF subfamily
MAEDEATHPRPDVTSARYLDPASSAVGSAPPAAATPPAAVDFVQVFREFGAYVPGLLRRLGVAEREVEDLAQDVFTVIYRQLPGFRGDSAVKTWVCGITLRVARSHLRLARVRKLFLGEPPVEPSRPATQLDSALQRERVQQLQSALEELTEEQRRVFVLYEIEDLSMHEIARILGGTEKTAYTRLHAAREKIERSLRRRALLGGES